MDRRPVSPQALETLRQMIACYGIKETAKLLQISSGTVSRAAAGGKVLGLTRSALTSALEKAGLKMEVDHVA